MVDIFFMNRTVNKDSVNTNKPGDFIQLCTFSSPDLIDNEDALHAVEYSIENHQFDRAQDYVLTQLE